MEQQTQVSIQEKTETRPPIKANWKFITVVVLVAVVISVGGILLFKETQTSSSTPRFTDKKGSTIEVNEGSVDAATLVGDIVVSAPVSQDQGIRYRHVNEDDLVLLVDTSGSGMVILIALNFASTGKSLGTIQIVPGDDVIIDARQSFLEALSSNRNIVQVFFDDNRKVNLSGGERLNL